MSIEKMSNTEGEKKRKNKGNVPNLRFQGFEGEWKKVRLSELSELITKGTTPKRFVKQGIRFVKIECIGDDQINIDKCLFIEETVHGKELKRSVLKENDLLFAIAGATIGKINIVTKGILPANTNQALSIIRLKADEDVRFVYQILKSDMMKKYIKDSISVGAQPNLNLEQMNNFSFFQPIAAEQRRLSTFLSAIDNRIQTQSKIIEEMESSINVLRQNLYSQKLRFIYNKVSSWENKLVKDVCEIVGGGTPDTSKNEYWNGNIQWFTPTEIKENFVSKSTRTITEQGLKNSSAKLLPIGTILLTTRATIGEVAIAQEQCTTNQGFQSLIANKNTSNIFLYHWLKNNKNELLKRANGSTFAEVSKGEIESIRISMPPYHEQRKIAHVLSLFEEKINIEKEVLRKYIDQKGFLLQNMFI